MSKIPLLLFLCAIFGNALAQQTMPSFVSDSLDAYVERSMRQWQIPGVAVCVVKDGKAVITKGYGKKENWRLENGKVKSVTVTVADFVEFTPYEFYKK